MGRVKNLGFKRNRFDRSKKGLLQPYTSEAEYKLVQLTDRNGKAERHYIHRLVAEHFIDNPNNCNIVDHISTNGADNRYFNLRWTTQQENMNNDKTKEKRKRKVVVLDKNGNVISSGLGVAETAKNIGIGKPFLTDLLKSHKPYIVNIKNLGGSSEDLLRPLNGARMYYIDEYNEEEVLKEIAEDKTDYSYCIGDSVCVFSEGIISEPMSCRKIAKELGVSESLIRRIRDSKKPYKVSSCCHISKEHLEHLKTLEGIRIMYYEDYLEEQSQQDNN